MPVFLISDLAIGIISGIAGRTAKSNPIGWRRKMKKVFAVSVGICLFFSGLCFAWCPPGDVTNDCRVNLDDLLILAGHWLEEGENAVPDVIGMTQSAAETAITDVYLAVGMVTQEYSMIFGAGLVISHDPGAGTLLPPDSKVNLVVSLGPVPGPDITWVTIHDPGVSGHEAFNGQMSQYETTNAQYCHYLNAAMASGDVVLSGSYVVGANGSNTGQDFAGENYYYLSGSGYTTNGATNGGAARINWTGSSFTVDSGFENHPVTYVSWYGAASFASYYGWRLPTEWEWQAAADYNGSYTYGCGTTINNSIANYRNSTHPDGTTAVGQLGMYGYGMCDLAGNVGEWTSTIYDDIYRINRGGFWNTTAAYCSSSISTYSDPDNMSQGSGFRVCR